MSPDKHLNRTALSAEAWESLFRAQVLVMRGLSAQDTWDQVTQREYDVLFNLSLEPDGQMRLRDLNRSILLAQPSLSRMVERLELSGLVTRHGDPDDKRGTVVELTAEGRRVQQSVGRRHVAHIRRLVGSALEAEELEMLAQLCRKLRLANEP